ncbi:PE-PGRS family protein [Mycobacterium tuberculosis 02_1987]|nr:PE-PGRS family protein [Mycobacterium tuberculosis 02_1987]
MGRPHLNIVAVRRISMSFVNVAPQLVSTAAADAARIGSAINTANTAAAATTQVLAAAQDEVSTAIAALFGSHGQHYQAISAQVAAYQQRFVLALSQAGSTYAVAEAASATPLQQIEQALLGVINTPTEALVGRKLIGDGAHGAPGTDQRPGCLCGAAAYHSFQFSGRCRRPCR